MSECQYKRILVPVDGSKITPRLMDKAIEVAKHNQARLEILNVIQVDQLTDGFASTIEVDNDGTYVMVKTIEERLDDLKQRALDAGVSEVSVHMRFGNPKEVIAHDFPRDHHNDLVIMGATGLSKVARVLVGSTTGFVVRYAPCDVMVIH